MAAWSSILRSAGQKLNGLSVLLFKKSPLNSQVRCMSEHHTMNIQGSKWQWNKTKDMLHFYIMLGVIPCTLITIFSYVFVGPATLEPIPEGYEPKHWEYYRNPITRFLVRYVSTSPQQEYEKFLCAIYYAKEQQKTKKLETYIEELIKQRQDYRFFYHQPVTAKYHHQTKKIVDDWADRGIILD